MNTLYPKSNFPDTYNLLESIFNNVYNGGIAILNTEGKWLKINDYICSILEYSRNELLNINIESIILKEDFNFYKKKYKLLEEGRINKYQITQRYFHKNGNIIWFLVSVSLLDCSLGKPYVIWHFTDITRRRRRQDKLKAVLNLIKNQNTRLTSFANIASHNLRSHSSNLSILSTFLEEEHSCLNEDENFILLKKAINNLQDTVTHLGEVAKIRKDVKNEIENLNLFDYVEKAIYNIAAIAKSTDTVIVNDIDKNVYIKGVPAYLDSIILNFLTNAIKYRSKNRLPIIKLTSFVQNDFVVFNVKDNGLGIDLDKYGDKMFQMYRTFHSNEDAIGIGLFITKNHVESIGGKVIVTSEVGVGSEFSIYLKCA